MKQKLFILIIVISCFIQSVVAVNSSTDNIIDNSFLNSGTTNLVNVDMPDDTNALLPKIYFFSMREGFIFIAGAALLVAISGVVVVFIMMLLIRDVLVGIARR